MEACKVNDYIKQMLAEANLKQTKQRIAVLEVLNASNKPLTAQEIYDSTNDISLATVYRILEQLCKKAIVIKNAIMDSQTASYELDRHEHKHYAVCLGCKGIVVMDDCPLENFHPEVTDNGFKVTGHKIEVYGYCKDCRKEEKK